MLPPSKVLENRPKKLSSRLGINYQRSSAFISVLPSREIQNIYESSSMASVKYKYKVVKNNTYFYHTNDHYGGRYGKN